MEWLSSFSGTVARDEEVIVRSSASAVLLLFLIEFRGTRGEAGYPTFLKLPLCLKSLRFITNLDGLCETFP